MSELPYPAWPELFRWLTILKDRVETIVAISAEQVITGEFDPDLIPPIPWDRVLKAGSSLGDLETTSAGDLSSGTLLAARMPALTGDVSSVVGTVTTTLATVNPHPGTYGAGMTIPLISVNAKGLVTDIVDYPIAGSPFTPGSVIFAGALGQFAEDNSGLFWDDANTYLGIGTSTPSANVHVVVPNAYVEVLSTTGTNASLAAFANGSGSVFLGINNSVGGYILSDSLPYAAVFGHTFPYPVQFGNDSLVRMTINGAGLVGIGTASPTARLHLPAGTTAATTAPLKFTSGSLLTSAEVGAVEFLTDAFYGTITTGAARKQFLLNDSATAFTAGSVPFATTNGRLTQDNANLFWDDTNNRLGIGTLSPSVAMHVNVSGNDGIRVSNIANGGGDFAVIDFVQATVQKAVFYTNSNNLTINVPNGTLNISAAVTSMVRVLLGAGTATANTAPLKFTSGTNLTTAEAGAMEYDGTDLFFTRAGTVRENVLVAIDNVAAPTTSIGVAIVNFYGANATNYLGDPNRWLSVNVLGATYKIPLYT